MARLISRTKVKPPTATGTALSDSQVSLTATAPAGFAIASYVFENAISGAVITQAGASYTFTGLAAYTLYDFLVRVIDLQGNSSSSVTVQVRTKDVAPTAPNISATRVNATRADITLTPSSSQAGVASYSFTRALAAGGPFTLLATQAGLLYSDTSLSAGVTYYYRAFSTDVQTPALNSPFSGVVSVINLNSPPSWTGAPAPAFTIGGATSYPLTTLAVDPDSDPITFSSIGSALPPSVSINNLTKALDYDGGGAAGTTSGIRLRASATGGTADSALFAITLTSATDLTTLSLVSPVGGTLLPFTVGHAFKQGDIPAGSYVTADIADFQADIQNTWPDGSAKIALLSGRRTLTAGVSANVTIRRTNSPPSGSALTLTQLRAALTVGTLTFSAGVTGTVSIPTVIAGAPARTRAVGPQMIEAHWRSAAGSDAHLVVWLYVRYYVGGQVEIETVVENGYLRVASPGLKTYTVVLALNGSTRYTGTALQHQHHTRWSRWDWYATDPAITPTHSIAYLKSTKLVPNVPSATPSNAAFGASSPNWGSLTIPATEANSGAPFSLGNFANPISGGGDAAAIGIVPAWEALYLSSGDARAYVATLVNARNFGRYPLCYRDHVTQQAPRLTQLPALAFGSNAGWNYGYGNDTDTLPANTGAIPGAQIVDMEHQPSAPFLAYLLTGRYQFIEACQFAAASNLISRASIRGGASCLYGLYYDANEDSGRVWAWGLRQAVWAACITPDSDTTMQGEFRTIVDNNVADRLAKVTTGVTANNLGIIAFNEGPESNIGIYRGNKTWMLAFFATVMAHAYDLQINASTATRTTHASLLTQVYKFVVGIHGNGTGFNYRRAGIYRFAMSSGGTGPVTGATFLPTWDAVYAATMASANVGGTSFPAISAADGLSLSNMVLGAYGSTPYERPITASGVLPVSFNAQVAVPLAYAVDHGAEGAGAAYTRLTGSTSWGSFSGEFADAPKWRAAPRVSSVPSWVPAAGSWAQVSLNTVDATIKGDFPPRFLSSRSISAKCENYSGAIWNQHYGTLGAWMFWGGGHSATDLGNEVYAWLADTRRYVRLSDPTYPGSVAVSPNWVTGDVNSAYDEPLRTFGELAVGVPAASHSRWNPCVLPPGNGVGAYGALAIPYQSAFHIGGNTQSSQGHAFDCSAAQWSRVGDGGTALLGGWTSCADTSGNLYRALSNGSVQKLAAGGSAWQTFNPSGWSGTVGREGPMLYIPGHDRIAAWRLNGGVLRLYLLDAASLSTAVVVPTLSGTAPSVPAAGGYGAPVPAMGMTWCEPLQAICGFLEGSKQVWALRRVTNTAWTWQQLTASNSPTLTGSAGDPELYNRFQYAPALRSFLVTRQIGNLEMWAFRPTELA